MKEINTIYGFLNYLYNNYEEFKNYEINLVYDGLITHQITKTFASLTEEQLVKEAEVDQVQRKVFHVMVECLQNISKHAEEHFEDEALSMKKGIILIAKGDDRYNVITGNTIENEKVPALSAILENLNSLSKEELTKLYKIQLKNNTLSDKGGAGLGFIDIARKTGEKLDFKITTINENYSYFVLITTILRISN